MALGQNHFQEAQELFKEAVERDPGNSVVSILRYWHSYFTKHLTRICDMVAQV